MPVTNETLSGTTSFDMPVDEIIELALEDLGGESVSYKEAKQARTALNLLFIEMQLRGMAPLASIELKTIPLVTDNADNYNTTADVFNIMDAVISIEDPTGIITDLPMQRISMTDWLNLPKKSQKSRPTHFMIQKTRNGNQVHVWPTPDQDKYTFKFWGLTYIDDVTAGHQLVGFPKSYLPAVVRGLTYYMAPKRNVPRQERDGLKQDFLESLMLALDDDRERVGFVLYPSIRSPLN